LRVGPGGLAESALWLVLVAVVGGFGFWVARRAHRAGQPLAEVAVVGLMAVLLSPVAWAHHLAWIMVSIAVIMGDGSSRRRLCIGLGVYTWFLLPIPWYANHPEGFGENWVWLGRIVQSGYTVGALITLGLLHFIVPRRPTGPLPAQPEPVRVRSAAAATAQQALRRYT
jgi:alpha-1,2-mannosyltransferase